MWRRRRERGGWRLRENLRAALSPSPCPLPVPVSQHICVRTHIVCVPFTHYPHVLYIQTHTQTHSLLYLLQSRSLMCLCVYTRQDTAERMAMRSVIEAKSTSTSSPASRPNLSAVSCFTTQKPNTVRECTQTDTHSHVNTLHMHIYILCRCVSLSLSVSQCPARIPLPL